MDSNPFVDSLTLQLFEPYRKALAEAYEQGRKDERDAQMAAVAGVKPETKRAVTPTLVLKAVAHATGIEDFQKQGGFTSHDRRTAEPRCAAAVMLRENCGLSYPHAAKVLGYQDHTTIMYALKTWQSKPGVVAIIEKSRAALEVLARTA